MAGDRFLRRTQEGGVGVRFYDERVFRTRIGPTQPALTPAFIHGTSLFIREGPEEHKSRTIPRKLHIVRLVTYI